MSKNRSEQFGTELTRPNSTTSTGGGYQTRKIWLILILFLLAMLWIHRYIFLYADDLYYSRDAQYGLNYLQEAILDELNTNGRAWIGAALVLTLKPQIQLFRILNPLILLLVVYIMAKMTTFSESSIDSKENPASPRLLMHTSVAKSLVALMHPQITFRYAKKGNPTFWIALLAASLFFLFLPLRIAHTTIYYAACAFNYLYPMTLVLLYAYLLYSHFISTKRSKKLLLLLVLLAFFVGSSTQQVGMIGIGFTVMISVYLAFIRRKVPFGSFLPFYGVILLGYMLVTYGSLKRLLWEKTAGNEAVLSEVITELLKTNIFSAPAAPFVLLISLSCIFWLITFSRSDCGINKTPKALLSHLLLHQVSTAFALVDFNPHPQRRNHWLTFFNIFLAVLLSLALIGYIYFLLYKENPIVLNPDNLLSLYGLGIIAFVILYLFVLVYTSTLILIRRNYPFLLFNSINAIGAQIMLIVVDARFAAAYKIMFPSLLLLSIFIFYSFLAFRRSTLYLALAFFLVTLSLQERILALAGSGILGIVLFSYLYSYFRDGAERRAKLMQFGLGALFCLICGGVFSITLHGYYKASLPQNYNLQAIRHYQEAEKNGVLLLKKVPPSYYGYNLGNWNDMPYFMKQCYGIKEDTLIEYID